MSHRATIAVLPTPEVIGLDAHALGLSLLLITVVLVSLSQAVWMLAT